MALDSLRLSSSEHGFQKEVTRTTKKAFVCIAVMLLFMVGIFSGSISSLAASAADSAGEGWVMFHHDLAHTGKSASTAPVTNQTAWIYNTGGPVGSPIVVGGLVYVGSYDDNFYALDASDGAVVWAFATGSNVLSPAAVAGGLVYFGSEDNNVYALNAETGGLVWNYTTGFYVDSEPAVANGVVYVASEDWKVYALNASSGDLIWDYKTGDMIMLSSAVFADGAVYVGSIDHNVYALNATDGDLIWSYATGDSVVSTSSGDIP